MFSNKDIVNAYKRPKVVKRSPRSYTWVEKFIWHYKPTIFIIGMMIVSILPTLAVGLYFKQNALNIAIRSVIALVSYFGIALLTAMPFMGAGVCSNPATSSAGNSGILAAFILGFVPQIMYVLFMLKNVIN